MSKRISPSFNNSFRKVNPPAGGGENGGLSRRKPAKARPVGVSVLWRAFAWIITIFVMTVTAGCIAYLIGQEWI